jgi:Ser/Thr protein kinase RdoA (MazF antagonist)
MGTVPRAVGHIIDETFEMMKLRHLFSNPALAEMLVKNWEYDEPSLELFRYFRISANAIYPFKRDDEVHFLRICPTSERSKENIIAELEFIHYLRNAQYNALEPVASNNGDELIQKKTPWGEYYACVFKRVKGNQLSETSFENEIVFAYGAALGQLHKLSSAYTTPRTRRWRHVDIFDWIEKTLHDLSVAALPINELGLLREHFSGLPMSQGNYGLVHYDFEPDNVFYDNVSKTCSVIDFDDAMYHWYVMDIVQALDSLKNEIPENEFPQKQTAFIEGYRSVFEIDQKLYASMPIFRRFANLYRYTRDLRAIEEKWENEPEWLVELRTKLNASLVNDSKLFGKTVTD